MSDKDYQKLHEERLKLINAGKTVFTANDYMQYRSFEEITQMQMGCNKCFTLYDMQEGRFIKWHLVDKLLGYSDEEFTIQAINNIGPLKIIHEEDIIHKLRYDNIIYSFLGNSNQFGIRMDSYCLSMRIKHRDNSVASIRRRSYIFHAAVNRPLTQFDEWEVNNRYKSNHVFPELILDDMNAREKITEQFYAKNLEVLNLSIKDLNLKVLHYKVKGESNNNIGKNLNKSPTFIGNIHSKNFDMLRDAFPAEIDQINELNAIKDKRENINVFREICRKYGLYPVPESLLYAKKHS